jgi:hypothetical protein
MYTHRLGRDFVAGDFNFAAEDILYGEKGAI